MKNIRDLAFGLLLILVKSAQVYSAEYCPSCLDTSWPTEVYWGDTHLHTNLSWDAFSFGNTELGPEDAYRFAKGETITAHNGQQMRLSRPLDFLVVADHASNMGVMKGLVENHPQLLKSELGRRWLSKIKEIRQTTDAAVHDKFQHQLFLGGFTEGSVTQDGFLKYVWLNVSEIADHHNDPGNFTTLIGFEWTQLFYFAHRVVIFKDDAKKTTQVIPFSQYHSNDPEDLWTYMNAYENKTGGEVLAIPHNGNLTSGIMFALEDASGNVFSGDYARSRRRWEPLFEVSQIKGDSETHPLLSPGDAFADYETWESNDPPYYIKEVVDRREYNGYHQWVEKHKKYDPSSWMRKYEYARSALKLGLAEEARLGTNPFKFGLVGSTDAHTSMAAVDENNFGGKLTENEPSKDRTQNILPATLVKNQSYSAAGYAAVWARENTREAIFEAMKRREVYATTGPRIKVRFFAGWDYQSEDAFKPDLASIGYEMGVPMGGDLTQAPKDQSPRFLIRAVKDADGANLDRIQIIKGWRDQKGELHEKIYNVALSDGRKENWLGKVKPVGNTVDIKDGSYTNSIGDPELAVVWRDPNFNQDEFAFYYARVLEIPTPRWTAYDAKFFQIEKLPRKVPLITQERAYTSPIWYSPGVSVSRDEVSKSVNYQ